MMSWSGCGCVVSFVYGNGLDGRNMESFFFFFLFFFFSFFSFLFLIKYICRVYPLINHYL